MIEGSFIKEAANGGAHNPEYFSAPKENLLQKFIDGNEGIIKIVNIPPEWGEVSYDAYKILKEKSIITAVGHTAANADEVGRAISLGMKLGIHLFNGPSFSSYKPFSNGGTIEALLKSDEVFVEIITDGFHVDKSYFMDAVKRKGIDKIIGITDNMFVTGHEIKDEFVMGNKTGVVSNDKKYLYIKDNPVALFGSNLNMKDAFENVLNWFTSDIEGVWNKLHEADTFENALLNSSKLFSANPAKLLNISHETGLLGEGKKADIIIADIQYNKTYNLLIDKIIVDGSVFDPD
jgi:N-acetylglucosamine-6-phosphate deacetylase